MKYIHGEENFQNGTATFVIPHYSKDNIVDKVYLDKALNSIYKQTDSNWNIVIIDDASPCRESVEYLRELERTGEGKIKTIYLEQNGGPGAARNAGVKYAYESGSPFVLFLDSDDMCHERRLEVVRDKFVKNPKVNVVYSTFIVIDEEDNVVPTDEISPSIQEMLDGHTHDVVEGENAWLAIAIEKNYTNLTSSTAVKTSIAYENPFPQVKVSEDMHAWLRYGAQKGEFCYAGEIPSLYRIPRGTESNTRGILNDYCEQKVRVDTDGFMKAMDIALNNGNVKESEKNNLTIKFYIKLAETMLFANRKDLALQQIDKAKAISAESTEKILAVKNLKF